jgi:3D (Asp-Asp-Asp) domain-containing protein
VHYRERLTPPWWLWLLIVSLTGTLAVAYGAAYGASVGWLVFVPTTTLMGLALVVTSPVVSVDDTVFRAGRARLPVTYAGAATALDAAAARAARSVDADARAYLVLRTWTTPRAVKVEVTDEEDPHPYWLVSVRRPDRVVAALEAVRTPAGPIG